MWKTFFAIIGGLAGFGLLVMLASYVHFLLDKRRWNRMTIGERLDELAGRMPEPPKSKAPRVP